MSTVLGGHILYKSGDIRVRSPRVNDDLGPERSADILKAPLLPVRVSGLAEREEDKIIGTRHEVINIRPGSGGHDIDFQGDLATVAVEREIVDVLTEGVLDLAANGGQAENDICGHWDLVRTW